jgi:hypothetical protein
MGFKRKLCKVFAAVAIFGGAMTVAAPPAQAISPAHVVIITSSSAAANNAAAAARARHNREARNDVIVNPTDAAITKLRERGLVDAHAVRFVREAVQEMHVPAGTKAGDVTEAQRDRLGELVNQKWLVAKMSAGNEAAAEAEGLSPELAKYLDAAKAELGFKGAVTLEQARAIEKNVEAKHWEKDTKPALQSAGLVAGGLAAVGAGVYALKRQQDRKRYGY